MSDPFEAYVHPTDDGDPRAGEVTRELERDLPSVAAVVTAAEDRDCGVFLGGDSSSRRRSVVQVA